MKQLADVHMLPTDKSCVIHSSPASCGELYEAGFKPRFPATGFELYFTNDEEIKEGNWLIATAENGQRGMSLHQCIGQSEKYYDVKGNFGLFKRICAKIVATTNPELKDKAGYSDRPSIPDIPESFIKAYISAYNAGNPIKQMMLEYEHHVNTWNVFSKGDVKIWRCNTCLKEWNYDATSKCTCPIPNPELKLNPDGSVIWSLKEEKMYPKPETGSLFSKAKSFSTGAWINTKDFNEWFDKNYPQ